LPVLCQMVVSEYAKLDLKREAVSALWNAVASPPTMGDAWSSLILRDDCRVSRNGCHSDRFNVECGRGSCAWFSLIDKCTPKAVGGSGPKRICGRQCSGCSRSCL
jgi:hypothetical protein